MFQVMIDVPNEVLFETHMNNDEATEFAKRMVALGYYMYNNISIGYCSKIAGVTEEEFIDIMGRYRVDIFRFKNEEELLKDVSNA